MATIELSALPPTAEDFARLRAACGWGAIDLAIAERALAAGLISVVARDGTCLAGFGRVVGDGVLYFYLQDVIVHPDFRGQGVGRMVVEALLAEVLRRAPIGATIGLMAAEGKEGFYEKFGFTRRPTERLGAGMTRFVLAEMEG
ncbi:GNAT family N-acetyltransferase [Pleomorphomonas sp. PLEO]|uniref:GNAT family N-acetyltransferase n=1 Tax=Pleomorphomonas sp. PLEO TaxID=3239306 RepID=UPI00351DC683